MNLKHVILQTSKMAGHSIAVAPLDQESVVIDLGANRGSFSALVGQVFGIKTHMVEASRELISGLTERFGQSASVLHCAVHEKNELVDFRLAENSEASSLYISEDKSIETVSLEGKTIASIFDYFGVDSVALLKVDIEGAEVPALLQADAGLLARIDQITVEFHNLAGLYPVSEVYEVVRRLKDAGFVAIRFDGLWTGSPHLDRDDHLNWLFLRPGAPGLPSWRVAYIRYVARSFRWGLQFCRRRNPLRRREVLTVQGDGLV